VQGPKLSVEGQRGVQASSNTPPKKKNHKKHFLESRAEKWSSSGVIFVPSGLCQAEGEGGFTATWVAQPHQPCSGSGWSRMSLATW
jgi:hypothetical protein